MDSRHHRLPGPGQRRYARGGAVIELALLLPLLLTLVFGVVDFARAIQFNNVLVAVAREGANLVARKVDVAPEFILDTLMTTAEPLDMSNDGIMYITEVIGADDGSGQIRGRIDAQYRPQNDGDRSLASRTYTCTFGWTNGKCNLPADEDDRPTIDLGIGLLNDGEKVYVVEALYDFSVLVGYVMKTGPELYVRSIL